MMVNRPLLAFLCLFLGAGCAQMPAGPDDAAAVDAAMGAMLDARPDAAPGGPFTLTSSAFVDQGTLPVDHTCDGAGQSPPLAWGGAPAETAEYALLMTTLARDGLKWNWVLHSIPKGTSLLVRGSMGVGVAGLTSDGPNLAYAPPCSQGPGAKQYTFTLYALSAPPVLPMPANKVTGDVLTSAISQITLASSKITVSHTR